MYEIRFKCILDHITHILAFMLNSSGAHCIALRSGFVNIAYRDSQVEKEILMNEIILLLLTDAP